MISVMKHTRFKHAFKYLPGRRLISMLKCNWATFYSLASDWPRSEGSLSGAWRGSSTRHDAMRCIISRRFSVLVASTSALQHGFLYTSIQPTLSWSVPAALLLLSQRASRPTYVLPTLAISLLLIGKPLFRLGKAKEISRRLLSSRSCVYYRKLHLSN